MCAVIQSLAVLILSDGKCLYYFVRSETYLTLIKDKKLDRACETLKLKSNCKY